MKILTTLLVVLCMCINVYAEQSKSAILKISDCLVAQKKINW